MTVAPGRPVRGVGRRCPPVRRQAPVTGHVYLDDNTAGANTIAVFDRHTDGSLTPLPGPPFAVGGAGTGAGLASESAVQIADGGRLLLAADAGGNQVSVLRIQPVGLRLSAMCDTPGPPAGCG
jgi:hypothetical protein